MRNCFGFRATWRLNIGLWSNPLFETHNVIKMCFIQISISSHILLCWCLCGKSFCECLPLSSVNYLAIRHWYTLSYTLFCYYVTFGQMNDHSNICILTIAIHQMSTLLRELSPLYGVQYATFRCLQKPGRKNKHMSWIITFYVINMT